MTRLRRLGAGVWEFVVGDDWRVAVGVAIAIGITAALAGLDVPAWWVMPSGVVAVLGASLRRAG